MIKQSPIECHHGRLRRQCQECDMEKEIEELTKTITEQDKVISELKLALVEIINHESLKNADGDLYGLLCKAGSLTKHKQSKGE